MDRRLSRPNLRSRKTKGHKVVRHL